MKLLLHYLKYDFLRWRWLVVLMWGLVAAYIVLMRVVAGWRESDGGFFGLGMASEVLAAVGMGCFALLCIMAGGADSVVRAQTWLMTRPRWGRAFLISRVLVIFCGAVLPGLVAWWGTLVVMKFDAATLAAEFPRVGLTGAALAMGLALWALVDPCIRGVIAGAVCTGIAAWLVKAGPGAELPVWYFRGEITLLTLAVPVVLASLPGLIGWRRRLTRRARAVTGFVSGIVGVVALAGFMPVENWFRHREDFDAEFAYAGVEEWRVACDSTEPQAATAASGKATFALNIPVPAQAAESDPLHWQEVSFSWRSGPEAAWSGWIVPLGRYVQISSGRWILRFDCPRILAPEMNGGEMRLRLEWLPRASLGVTPPPQGTARWQGPGWTSELYPLEPQPEGGWKLVNVSRSIGRDLPWVSLDEDEARRGMGINGGTNATSLRLLFLQIGFQSLPIISRVAIPPQVILPPPLPPGGLVLTVPRTAKEARRILYITGVTMHRPLSPAETQSPSDPPFWQTQPPVKESRSYDRTMIPWTGEPASVVPPADAGEAEVALFIHRLCVRRPMAEGEIGWPARAQSSLAALVPRWLPLFIEAAVQCDLELPLPLRRALADGTPEDRRGELLRRIPEAAVLALIAQDRGWLEELRPFVLESVLREGGVVSEWEPLIQGYRLPDFHASPGPVTEEQIFHRQPRGSLPFAADLSLLQPFEWETAHRLGEELTRRLVPVLEKARTENEPAWHLALRFSEFLYHGETAALEALIRHLRDRPDPAGWRGELLRRWTRQADKLPAPAGEAALRDFARSSSAADFLRDPEQRLWMRQPQAPAP